MWKIAIWLLILPFWVAFLSSCSKDDSPSRPAPPPSLTASFEEKKSPFLKGLKRCKTVSVDQIEHREIRFKDGRSYLLNDRDKWGSLAEACVVDAIGFNRFLMENDAWVNDAELLRHKLEGHQTSQALAAIYVLGVWSRGASPEAMELSQFGSAQLFPGALFTKWTATESQVMDYSRRHLVSPVSPRSSWSVNGTLDDRTGGPVHIGCSSNDATRLGDAFYVGADDSMGNVADKNWRAVCGMWFGVNFGKTRIAVVKIQMVGSSRAAKKVIDAVRNEIIARFAEISE